ncbi:MAG: PAS domain-containing sensor histidine kinase, partial [Gammaproteobacteria bacterium]
LEQSRALNELVRGLAHEIKNPLGGLRGAAQLLESELADPALREYTSVIIEEADRLRALVDRLLGPSGLPRRERLNLHEVLEHVRTLVLAEGHLGLRIERDYDPSIPELEADRDALVQAVLNIVRNAVEALAGEGTIWLQTRTERQVTIGSVRHRLAASVRIIDNGPGVPEALRERLFVPLVTGRAQGTGLGLAIAQNLVGRHGGIIEFESRPGHTCFNLLLPLEAS